MLVELEFGGGSFSGKREIRVHVPREKPSERDKNQQLNRRMALYPESNPSYMGVR